MRRKKEKIPNFNKDFGLIFLKKKENAKKKNKK